MTNYDDIIIRFDRQPIPDRNFDWHAMRVSYDYDDPVGCGGTPLDAVKDLLDEEDQMEGGQE